MADDVLNILNTNTQNNDYNSGKSSDDELKILNENTEGAISVVNRTKKYSDIGLSDDEKAAQEQGNLDYVSGVNHVDEGELNYLKSKERERIAEETTEETDSPTEVLNGYYVNADGTPNTTASLATDLVKEEESTTVKELFRDTLGRTAYEDLKESCGLSKNDSFTDFYNRTHYIPKGYEVEARMCLIEEKRMKLYNEYVNGNISESNFLYEAYGKDLMKEAGYDLSSKLFWYNRYKNNDFTNPLDSDTFISDLLTNAKSMWQAETWYRDASEKELSDTLAGLVTGERLSSDKFYEVFKTQIDALKPYFDNDVNKILTYYKAGSLGSAFSPFVDIDGDGKFDYYYHTDGRLYAVNDSSGTGNSKCTLTYNDDGSVHSVQINDGFDGPVDSLLEGFRDFWVGILDIVQMVDSAAGISAVVHAAKGDKYFMDAHQNWEAFKKSTWALGDEDYVVFDDVKKYNGKDWANSICKGVGQVVGMVLLTIATWGIGGAASAGGKAAGEGAKVGAQVASELGSQATAETVQAALSNIGTRVAQQLGENASKAMVEKATQYAIAQVGKELSKQMGKAAFEATIKGVVSTALKRAGTTAAKLAISKATTGALKAASAVLQAGTKGRSGFVITTKGVMGNVWMQSAQVAATNAVKDFVMVGAQLEARNPGLKYLEKATDGQVKALSTGDIVTRALAVAGADFAISTLFRAQGDIGASTRFNSIASKFSNNKILTENAMKLLADPNLTQAARTNVLNMTRHMGVAMWTDNAFDIIENITTAGVQAAMSNPYAVTAGQKWETFWQSAYNPQSIIMNAYIGMKNTISFGTSSNMVDSRKSTFIREANLSVTELGNATRRYISDLENSSIDPIKKDAAIAALEKFHASAMDKMTIKQDDLTNASKVSAAAKKLNAIIEVAGDMDKVFSIEDERAIKAFGLTKVEAKEIRDAISLLNKNRPDGVPEYGMATAMLFNSASKKYAEEVRAVYVDLLNGTAEKATNVNKVWKSLIDFSGKLPFADYIKTKHSKATFESFIESVAAKSQIDLTGLRKIDLRDMIVSNRFKTLNLDTGTSYAKFKQAIDSGLIKTYVLDQTSSMAGYTYDIQESVDDDGKTYYKVVVLDANRQEVKNVDNENPFYQLLMDKANNKEAIDTLIRMGIITSVNNEGESESLYNIISTGTPWFGFTIDQARRNEIFAKTDDNSLRDIVIALDTISDLCNPSLSADSDGYAGIDWSTPLFARVNYTRKNSSGGESETSLYIIPNPSSSNPIDVVNRMQAAEALVYEYYKILSLSKSQYRSAAQDEELQRAVAGFTMLMDEKLVMEDYEDLNRVLSDPAKRKAYLEERLPQVAKAILYKADMSKDETPNGFGRNQLVKLYKDGILNEDILKDFANESEKSSGVGAAARELLKYTELVNTTKTVLEIVNKLNSKGTLTNADLTLMKQYVGIMNDPSNASIRSYLEKDNYLSKYLQQIIDDPTRYIPFFNGLVGSGRHLSREECSAILEKRRINDSTFQEYLSELIGNRYNDFVKYSNTYVESSKKTLTRIFYGDKYDYNNPNNYFKTLSKDRVLEFMLDPIATVKQLSDSDVSKLFGYNKRSQSSNDVVLETLTKTLMLNGYMNEDGTIDKNKIFIETFNYGEDKAMNALEIKRHLLKGDTEQANFYRNLILIASRDYIGEIPSRIKDASGNEVDFIRVKDGNLIIGKDDQLLGEYLFNNENAKQILIESKKASLIERINNDIELYDKYIGEGSELSPAKHVVEVNLLELLPKNLRSAVSKYIESVEAKEARGRKASMLNDQIKSDMETLFTGTFSTSTTEQYNAYKKMVLNKILDGNFLYSYDINNPSSMNKFKTLIASLGYGKDETKILSGALIIDGITVKDKPVHVLKTEVDAQKVFSTLFKLSPVSFISTVNSGKDYKMVLNNLFSGNQYVDDNTTFDLIVDGKPIKFANGYSLEGTIDEWTQSEGLSAEYFDRAIKAALQGGQFSDYFRILNKSTTFDGTINESSYETSKALAIINRVFDYLFGDKTEYHENVLRIPAKVNSEKYNSIMKMYSQPNSIWDAKWNKSEQCIYLSAKKVSVNDFIKSHITDNNNEFDVRELIPIWDAKPSLKSVDLAMNKDVSFETLFSIVSEMPYEELTTVEDLYNYASKPIKLMSVDEDEYTKFVLDNNLSGKTIKEIESILSENEELIKNNYYANMLEYYFKTVRASSNVLIQALNTDETSPIIKLCNKDILDNLGELLNGTYSKIFSSDAIEETEVKALAEELSNRTGKVIEEKSLSALLRILQTAEENQLVSLSTNTGLAKRNPTLNAFSFLEIGDEGKLTLSLEDYIKASKQDRDVFLFNLNKILLDKETFTPEELEGIKSLIETLNAKDSLITELHADRELTVADSNLKTIIAIEGTMPNEPSIKINPNEYFISSDKNFNKRLVAELIANREFLKQGQDKYISLSSITDSDDTTGNLLTKFMRDALNRTLEITTDKTGSALIYNMQSDEAVAEFFMSAYTWANYVKEAMFMDDAGNFINKFKGLSEAQVDKMLYDLAMQANLYSTGTTFAAEYAGALILEYDPKTKTYEIKPVVTSVSNPDNDILSDLMIGRNNINEDTNKVKYMIKVKQNTFIDNVSGYDSGFDVFDLNDESVRRSIYASAYYNAKRNKGTWYINPDINIDFKDMINDYYIKNYKLKAYDIRLNFYDKCRQYGLKDDVIRTSLQTVENISSSQETSWSEQAIKTLFRQVGITNDPFVENYQFKALHDSLLYGINKDSLSDETIFGFKNYILSEEQKLTDNSKIRADDIAEQMRELDSAKREDAYRIFAKELSADEQVMVIKHLLLDDSNVDGLTLTLIANARNGKTLFDVCEKLITDYSKPSYLYDEVSDEVYVKPLKDMLDNLRKNFDNKADFDSILKTIAFDDIDLSHNKDLFDNIDLYANGNVRFSRNNKFLVDVIKSFQLMETTKSLRADSKELENRIKDVLLGGSYTGLSRKNYISSVKQTKTRNEVRNILFNLLAVNGIDIHEIKINKLPEESDDALKSEALERALNSSFSELSLAAKDYVDDLKKSRKYSEEIQNIGTADKIEIFLASGEKNMLKYLQQRNAFKDVAFKQFSPLELKLFDTDEGRKYFNAIKLNFNFADAEHQATISRFVNTVMNPLNEHMTSRDESYLSSVNPEFLLSNLIRVSGYTTEAQELYEKKIEQFRKYGNIIQITSEQNKDLNDYIINEFFQKELFQKRALWSMAREHSEFQNGIAYGAVKINPKILKDAFGVAYENGKEFYTLMWRQPGQQRTVVHNVKIIPDDTVSGIAFSRRTARDYFNGDFDGDDYFFAQPDSDSQFFGEKTFNVLNYGGSIYDSLFDDVDIPTSSAKEFSNIEKNVTPFFKRNSTAVLIDNILKGNAPIDLLYSGDAEFEGFKPYLEKLGYSEKDIDSLWKAFGLREVTTPMIGKNKVIISNNYILDTLGNLYTDAVKSINEGNQAFLRSAFFASDDDATWLGQSSKGQKKNFKVKEALIKKVSDSLYETTVGMSKDSNAQLIKMFASISENPKAINKVKDHLISYIELGLKQGFVSKTLASTLENEIKAKQTIDQDDVLVLAQLLQISKVNSKSYDQIISDAIKAPETSSQRTLNNQRLQGLIKVMNQVGGYDGLGNLEAQLRANPYGPTSLAIGSELAGMLLDRRLLRNPMFLATKDNIGVTKLLRDFATKADVDILSKNNINFISHKNISGINKNIVGLSGKVIVAIQTNGEYTDSIGVYDRSKNGEKNLLVNQSAGYELSDLTDSQKTKLLNELQSAKGIIDTRMLANILKDSSFDIDGKQKVIAFVDRLGQVKNLSQLTIDDLNRGARLIFNNSSSLLDHVKNHVVKFGVATTKDFKGTGYATDIEFDKKYKGNDVPQFILDQKIASMEKLAPLTGFKNLNKTITDSTGTREFALCEIDNVALLNVLDMEDMSYSNRQMDVVSLLSGSQGIDASFNMGSLFITINEDGKVVYDPSGYNNLMSTIGKYTKPILQDVNGCNLVRYNRIAILLDQLKDKPEFSAYIKNIADKIDSDAIDAKSLMSSLEKVGDLGGYTGQQIEMFLYSKMSLEDRRKFKQMLNKEENPFARVFFSKEVQDALKSEIQTSAEIDDAYVAQKKEDVAHKNSRVANVSNYSDGINYVRMFEGSAEDLNTAFISRRSLLNLLLTELNKLQGKDQGLNSSLLNTMLRTGEIKPEDIWAGSIADGYNPILKYQGLAIDPETHPERTQSKKAGMFFNIDMASRNEENENLIGYIGKSLLSNNGHDYDTDMLDLMDDVNANRSSSKYYTYTPATRIMPYLTRGTDEDIFDGLTGYKNQFVVERMGRKLSTKDNDLSLVPEWSTKENFQAQGAPEPYLYMSASEASNYLSHIENKEQARIYAELLDSKKTLFKNELDNLTMIQRLNLLEERQKLYDNNDAAIEFKKLLAEAHVEQDIENFRTIEQGTYDEACWDNLSEANLITAVQLTSTKNGYEFYNSAMRSWGFKSDNNMDIALGSKVLRLNSVSDTEAKTLLGNEYIHLINASKYCKDLSMQLEQYLQAKKLLELYESFVSNEIAYRKAMPKSGSESYDACMKRLTAVLNEQGGLDSLRTYLDSMYKNNVSLRFLIDDATEINRRIIEAAKQESPYEMVSWFVRLDDKKPTNKWFGFEHVNAFDLSHQKFDDILLGSMSSNRGKLASIFSGTDDGYLASVTIAATNLAKKKSMKALARYMQDNGYMSNLDLYSISTEQVQKDLQKSFLDAYTNDLDENRISKNQQEYDKQTYNMLKYVAIENGLSPKDYDGYHSFIDLYDMLSKYADAQRDALHYSSFHELVEARNAMQGYGNDSADKEKLNAAIGVYNAAQNTLSTMVAMMVERGQFKSADTYLSGIYKIAMARARNLGDYVIVDKYGAKLDETDRYTPSFLTGFDMDDAIREMRYGKGISGEKKNAAIAQMILCGDAYLMKSSLADQLEHKVFTKLKHSKFYNLINKCKNLATSLIMSSPTQLLDRVMNFPMFDLGVDATADFRTLNEVPTAKATVSKFVAMFDTLTQDQIENDKDMQYLIRFLYASNQELKNPTSFRGEKLSTGTLPVLKQYLKMTNQLYTIGNVIPRFAYYLNIVKNAESRGYDIDPLRMGVAYHMQDGIKQITNDVDEDVYRYIDSPEDKQKAANIDAQAVQIIAEHNGIEGNMPYAATWLNQHFNTMFITFPMALLRWADNRIRSLGYALSQCTKGTEGWQYLGDQVASNVITGALLLMLQLALSTNTQEWMKKKISKKDDEITEEEQEAAQNILFRGGQVKLFGSLLAGEEVNTAAHSRGPVAALFDSYIADFIPKFNGGEENFGTNLLNKIKQKTLGHVPFVLKDAIESIPGNTWLQSSTYFTPGDNYLENLGRKALGYTLGTANANAVIDYYQTADRTTDDSFLKKLGDGMQYAFTRKFANTKEAKSEHRNYKKAFTLIYEYKSMTEKNYESPVQTTDSKYFSDLKKDLQKALVYMGDSSALYKIMLEYKQKGVSLKTMRAALKSISLKRQLLSMDDYQEFMRTLSPQEKAVIKSALAYEDYNYPFLDDAYKDIAAQYEKEKENEYKNNRYVSSVGSLLKTMNYNTPKNYTNRNYNRYRNYSNYVNFINRYLNNVAYNNRYSKSQSSPLDSFNAMRQAQAYGTSKDVWGNETRNYTDGTTYTVRQPGMPFPGGNN